MVPITGHNTGRRRNSQALSCHMHASGLETPQTIYPGALQERTLLIYIVGQSYWTYPVTGFSYRKKNHVPSYMSHSDCFKDPF